MTPDTEALETVRADVADLAGSGDIRYQDDIDRWKSSALAALDSLASERESHAAIIEAQQERIAAQEERIQELERERDDYCKTAQDHFQFAAREQARAQKAESRARAVVEATRYRYRLG